jgi:MFS family permease
MTERARFDGWRIVALGAALIWLGPGLFEVYGFLATPLGGEFGLSAQAFGAGLSIFILANALSGPAIGALLDRGPLRPLLLGAIVLAALALAAMSRAQSVATLAGAAVVTAIGVNTYGQIGPQVMVAGWFSRLRSRALALTSLGWSAAGVSIPLIAQPLIARLGWRGALLTAAGAVLLLLLPAVAWLAVKRPEDVAQTQDGDAPAPRLESAETPQPEPAASAAALLRDGNFWLLGAALVIGTGASLGGVFLVKHMETVGVMPSQARYVLATMSGGALFGRVCTGWLHDRLPKQWVAAAVFALSGVGWLGISSARDLPTFLAIALPAGLAAGGFGVSGPVLQAACFGPAVLGRVMGLHGLLGLPVLLAAAPLVGRAADAEGGFAPVFRLLALVMLAAALVMTRVRATRCA